MTQDQANFIEQREVPIDRGKTDTRNSTISKVNVSASRLQAPGSIASRYSFMSVTSPTVVLPSTMQKVKFDPF